MQTCASAILADKYNVSTCFHFLTKIFTCSFFGHYRVQKCRVQLGASYRCEGLKRVLEHLEDEGIKIGTLITDRHRQVEKSLRTNRRDITHLFDVWHVAKGIKV